MTEHETQEQPPQEGSPASDEPRFQRQPPLAAAQSALRHMRRCSKTESRRAGSDLASELLLPASSILLVIAIWVPGPPQLRALAFLLPLLCFFYYLTLRIGVAATFTSRQAYLTWHMLIATFLMGGTAALFGVYVIAYLMRIALSNST